MPLQIADFPASVVTIIQGTIVLAVVIANEIARRVALRRRASAAPPPAAARRDGGTGPAPSRPQADDAQGARA